jgi:WD40 repeat protein
MQGGHSSTNNNNSSTSSNSIKPIACATVVGKVRGIDFSDTGEYFVSCGDGGHLMFWHTQQCYTAPTSISSNDTVSVNYSTKQARICSCT